MKVARLPAIAARVDPFYAIQGGRVGAGGAEALSYANVATDRGDRCDNNADMFGVGTCGLGWTVWRAGGGRGPPNKEARA
jgi:hypothetical protein